MSDCAPNGDKYFNKITGKPHSSLILSSMTKGEIELYGSEHYYACYDVRNLGISIAFYSGNYCVTQNPMASKYVLKYEHRRD